MASGIRIARSSTWRSTMAKKMGQLFTEVMGAEVMGHIRPTSVFGTLLRPAIGSWY